jgi:hypothetical protein
VSSRKHRRALARLLASTLCAALSLLGAAAGQHTRARAQADTYAPQKIAPDLGALVRAARADTTLLDAGRLGTSGIIIGDGIVIGDICAQAALVGGDQTAAMH